MYEPPQELDNTLLKIERLNERTTPNDRNDEVDAAVVNESDLNNLLVETTTVRHKKFIKLAKGNANHIVLSINLLIIALLLQC